MHLITKATFTLAFGILFIFLTKSSLAQPAAFSGQLNTMRMNQQMNMSMQMQMLAMGNLRGGDYLYNHKYTFQVLLKDSSKKEVSSKIYIDTVLHKNYLILVDKKFQKSDSAHRSQKIYADQTIKISRSSYAETTIDGFANDSCWMFKVIEGPLSAYSYLSERDANFSPLSLTALQLNKGVVMAFTKENLKQMIGEDVDALEYIEKKNYVKAIKKYNQHVEKAAKKANGK